MKSGLRTAPVGAFVKVVRLEVWAWRGDRNDALTEVVAKKVVEIGLNGVRDPAEIANTVVKVLGLSPSR